MLNGQYFYNQTIKKVVAVFGTVFNNIKIVRRGGSLEKVPIAYAPKEKWLARIRTEREEADKPHIAIKLPRMGFEITSISYDTNAKLNKMNKRYFSKTNTSYDVVNQAVSYRIALQLNILSANQDEALQVVEQILPAFTPEYTIAIKNMEGPNTSTDVPIVLTGVSFSDDYEGDFNTRRTIIYTLDFEMRARFFGNVSEQGLILTTDVFFFTDLYDSDDSPLLKTALPYGEENVRVAVDIDGSPLDSPADITTTFGFDHDSP